MRGKLDLHIKPVTPSRWNDLKRLFGEHGAFSGCWCMYFRLRASEFAMSSGSKNKRAMKNLIHSRAIPGLIAYLEKEPIAWVSLAPREEFAHLEHSRVLKRVDDEPVWSIVCFFVAKPYRNSGVMSHLLHAATSYASKRGARIVEAYPIEARNQTLLSYHGFTGVVSTLRREGFVIVKQVSSKQAIMRYTIK
jgi:GNAT superfamily N-acetyltransferase